MSIELFLKYKLDRKNFHLFSFIFLPLFVWPVFVLAQIQNVTPLIIDIKAEARDIIKKSITVSNDGDYKIDLYPVVNNVLVGAEGVQEFLEMQDSDKSTSLANWIHFPRAVIELEPGESKTVVFSIHVNLEARPGVYHARIAFPAGSIRSQAEENVDGSPAAMINLEVQEKVNELLELKKFVTSKSFFLSLPANVLFSLENIGNKELIPKGEVIVYDRKGREINSVTINAEGKKISPGNVIDLAYDIKKLGFFGKYKAFLSLRYGENQKGTITDSVYFYVVPWQILSGLIVFMAAFFWLVSVWIHRRRASASIPIPGDFGHGRFHASHPLNHNRNFHSSRLERPARGRYYGALESVRSIDTKKSSVKRKDNSSVKSMGISRGLIGRGKKDHGHVMDLRNRSK